MTNRANFAGDFGFIGQVEFQRMARDVNNGDRATRVFFAALGCANQIGHAEFGPGELAQALGIGYSRAADKAASKAVAQAKSAGWIESDSGIRCLVLSPKKFQIGKGTVDCKFHGVSINDIRHFR